MNKLSLLVASGLTVFASQLSAQDWSGGYAGLQFGGSDIDTSIAAPGDGGSVGGFAGYNFQSGSLVYGVELDFDKTDYDIGPGAAMVDDTLRVKGRLGTEVGNGLLYGTAGVVRASTDVLGTDTGLLFGIGYELPVAKGTVVGAEVLRHDFNDFDGSGIDVDVTTYKLRVGFRF